MIHCLSLGAGRKPTGRKPCLIRLRPETMLRLRSAARPRTVGEFLDFLYTPK